MLPERLEKIERVVKNRQSNLTVILENVHDHHNIGAVLRTCDAVGVKEVFVLYTEAHLDREYLEVGTRSAKGARRWVDVRFYTDVDACFAHVRRDYDKVYSTHLAENSVSAYDLDLTESVALLFGNEHFGVSKEAQKYSDGNFIIPMVGMVQSLNISVACAVTLYEAYRQRAAKGFYDENRQISDDEASELFDLYENRQRHKLKNKLSKRLNE